MDQAISYEPFLLPVWPRGPAGWGGMSRVLTAGLDSRQVVKMTETLMWEGSHQRRQDRNTGTKPRKREPEKEISKRTL